MNPLLRMAILKYLGQKIFLGGSIFFFCWAVATVAGIPVLRSFFYWGMVILWSSWMGLVAVGSVLGWRARKEKR